MGIRDVIYAAAEGWSDYASNKVVDKTAPAYKAVVHHFPLALQGALSGRQGLKYQGSTGAGNVTAAPWVAVFDLSVTGTAQDGFYVVYLFDTTLETVTLTIAFGVTQFTRAFGKNKTTGNRILDAVGRLQTVFVDRVDSRLTTTQPDLKFKTAGSLHASYQVSVVFSVPTYQVDSLPSEEQLVEDLQATADSYRLMVSDALLPSMDDLVAGSSESEAEVPPEVIPFVLREFNQGQEKGTGSAGWGSQASGKTGRIGEDKVYEHERSTLQEAGQSDLAEKVRPHYMLNEYCGWDITSYSATGKERRIEVKSTTGKMLKVVELTANEWAAALTHRRGFELCLVSKVLTKKPVLAYVVDPFSYVEESQMVLKTAAHRLWLGPNTP